MRRIVFISAVLSLGFIWTDAHAITLDDVQYWVGQGQNQAGFVVDFNDGRSPLLWGYQWDGAGTAEQMVLDLVAADSRLFAKATVFNFGGPDVLLINGVGYDRDNDGFALDDGTTFTDGLSIGPASDGAMAADSDDSYAEGFDTGFWSYYIGDGNPYLGGMWTDAQTGISQTPLVDGGFQGIRFAPGFVSGPPVNEPTPAPAPGTVAAPLPEPAAVVLLAVSALGLCLRRRSFWMDPERQ